jgi:4-amino-4-deoxy-L-arabinose transferase-like glycosyltransferase
MQKSILTNYPYHWLLLLLIVGLLFLKLEALSLPFFWDEAWSYLPAIRVMAEQGPSLMPGSIDTELYRGHPLVFYFLSSLWIKTFGYSLPIAHLFPLIISVLLLISVYFIAFSWTNSYSAGFIAALLVFIQPIFLTQSTFLLSEIMLSLFFVWSFWFYFKQKWFGFGVAMVAALLTKESAYCLVPAFVIISVIEWYLKKIETKLLFKNISIITFLFLVGFSFFIFQKIKFGWLFFPLHTGMIDFNEFGNKMEGSFLVLFLAQGRNVVFLITFIVAFVSLLFLKNKLSKDKIIIIISILIFTFGFMLFASINFFSARYLFGCIPLLMIGCTLIINNISNQNYLYAIIAFFVVLGIINIKKSTENQTINDVELSYTKLLKVQVQMVDYMNKSAIKEQIYAPFLMYYNLNTTYAGFISNKKYQLTQNVIDSNNVYLINVSNERLNELDSLITNKKISLLKRFEISAAFIELYKKTTN